MKRTACYQITFILLSPFFLIPLGCRNSDDSPTETPSVDTLPDSLFLTAAPKDIQSISSLKLKARQGDTVAINAVVGGRVNAFVKHRAVMTVVDATLDNPCTAEGHSCEKPWDYCCTPPEKLLLHTATVQILGSDNRALTIDLSTIENLKPLTALVIRGTVGPRADETSLTINATGIFVVSEQG